MIRLMVTALLLAVVPFCLPAPSPVLAATSKMGINVAPLNYWTENGFIDILKSSGAWGTYPGVRVIDVNENGLPRSMPAGATMLSRMVYLSPASAGKPVLYDLVTDGDLTVQMQGATIVRTVPGKTTFSYTGSSRNGVSLIIRSIRKPPSFMRLSRLEETALIERGELWRPAFVEQLRGFAVIRFMDWMQTNGSTFVEKYPSNQANVDYTAGVPIAIMNNLCAKVRARCWFNVPATASDALIGTMIGSAPTAIWEPSNEVWNLGFAQGRMAQALGSDGKGTGGAAAWYGTFATRIARSAQSTGTAVVLGWQTAVPERSLAVWDAVKAAGGKDTYFSGWIIATYVSGSLTTATGPTLELAASNDIEGALENLHHSREGLSVNTMAPIYAAHGAIARTHALPLIAYESNFHLNAVPALAGYQRLVVPFFERVQRAPASQAVTAANIDAFEAAGGSLNVFFNLASSPSGGGFFGIVGTPTFEEARERIRKADRP